MEHRLGIAQNRWFRILGVAFVMYVLSFIDRTNIAMAIPGLRADLGLTTAQIGLATSTFFWGYILLQIPMGRLASTWSAKRVIGILLVLWSGVSITTAFVHTEWQLILNRFALGVTEGGVLTAVIVLNRAWFSSGERARANTLFLASLAVGPALANPVSGMVLSYVSWRWMFVIEGLPALLWGLVWWWAIADKPEEAPWLPETERRRLLANLQAEPSIKAVEGHWSRTLLQPAVLLLAFYNFLALAAEYSVIFWMPSVLKETGLSIGAIGWLSAIPYATGALAMIVVAISSDHFQERKWHMVIASALSGVFLILAQLPDAGNVWMVLALLTLANAAFFGRYGPFWTLPSEVLPPAVMGVGVGLINGAGNLGGSFGPYFVGYLRGVTHSFSLALTIAGAALVLSSLVALPLKSRRARKASVVPTDDIEGQAVRP